jgi:1,4-dihydroxy-2-naphthoate octaprenyltransferase
MPLAEPTLAALSNPFARYFLATRPPFLTVTLFACLIGLATAHAGGVVVHTLSATLTLVFALVAHAGVNVLNDYYDALNGTDGMNTDRVYPFTGGSRFIQNGVLTLAETAAFGAVLFLLVTLAGFWLTLHSGTGLLLIGATGLFIGWAYSAPPFKLNSRGLGEPCVALGFGLIAVGTDYVQRGTFAWLPFAAVVSYALLVTNILYINQFPDRCADEAAGKHHWVVRLGPQSARWGYVLIGLFAYGWVAFAVVVKWLPQGALLTLLTIPLTWQAARQLLRYASQPQQLAPAIKMTIATASVHGLILALAIAFLG